jgi:hypothetical protein
MTRQHPAGGCVAPPNFLKSQNMAAAIAHQQPSRLEEIPAEVTSRIVPTLLKIDGQYRLGTDKHYRYTYLAQRLVPGTERNDLVNKKLSQMYRVFEKQYGKEEALALMIHLFNLSNDPISAEQLEALVNAGHYRPRAPLLFSGRRVNEEERAKFNFRKLTASIADELEESKREDFITILQDQTGEDRDTKATNYRNILDLMTKACNSGILEIQQPTCSEKLLEWLGQLGYRMGGDLTVMKEIHQFDSKKRFPGCGPDSMQY